MIFPPVRMRGFFEHRIRTPVRGSILNEETDRILTEPITSQLRRWLNSGDSIVFSPLVAHSSLKVKDATMISVCYSVLKVDKTDAVQCLFGT